MAQPAGANSNRSPDEGPADQAQRIDVPARSWVVPIVTVAILATAFCLYYFVYVKARREYLLNRNFRALAAVGAQLQRVVSVHSSILGYYAALAESKGSAKQDLSKYLLVRPEDVTLGTAERDEESRLDYLRYLAPGFGVIETGSNRPSAEASAVEFERRDGRWQLVLRARHATGANYAGSLDIEQLLKQSAASAPFDDILLVSTDGTVVFQEKQAGPHFNSLRSLLRARISDGTGQPPAPDDSAESQKGSASGHSDPASRRGPPQLSEVLLAGTRYKLFVQPVLIDANQAPGQDEKPHEWFICGLRSSSALEWEALAISYTFVIIITALFFAICLGEPILKVIFINDRERFRLRELGFLLVFLVLLASVVTLTAVHVVEFGMNNSREDGLHRVAGALARNVHDDLASMREQLIAWCKAGELGGDLAAAQARQVIRNSPGKLHSSFLALPPGKAKALFVGNAFWTDDNGMQVVKWSTTGYVTPMIDLSKEPVYTSPRRTYLDGHGPPFHFESVLPPNRLDYVAAMSMDTNRCNPSLEGRGIRGDLTAGAAIATGQPFSLIDPVLPFGYGFALIDDSGLVLFHSDKTRNGRENFREESDWNKELYASAFGHSAPQSLQINYLGRDYRALVTPVPGITQAPWSLIVYTDLTVERTMALQTIAMAGTITVFILSGPALLLLVWWLVRRPRFAPEWLWPNQHRIASYVYQICLYALLTLTFLFLAFTGPAEQILLACVAVPYAALLLTLWCFHRYPSSDRGWRAVDTGHTGLLLAGVTLLATAAFLSILILHWPHMKGLIALPIVSAIAVIPLLDRPRRRVLALLRMRATKTQTNPSHTQLFAVSILLLLLLLGVLMPMAIFRECLTVERRLAVKQAQLHIASTLAERRAAVQAQCRGGDAAGDLCRAFEETPGELWRHIVVNPWLSRRHHPHIESHRAPSGEELYEDWFRRLVYALHHEYNTGAAETLAVISDRPAAPSGGHFPEWSWERSPSELTLRWHGVAPNGPQAAGADPEQEKDLVITSDVSGLRPDPLRALGVAAVVTLIIAGIVWMLMRKVFMIHVAPLTITGMRELAECLRDGQNVLILVTPRPEFCVEESARTLDLSAIATGPDWAQNPLSEPLPRTGVVAIDHFEYSSEFATAEQKAIFLKRLIERERVQAAVIMHVPVSAEDYRRLFPQLTVIDLRDEPLLWRQQYAGPAQDMIWAECSPLPALWPLGAQLAKEIGSEAVDSEDTIPSEVLERADAWYRMVWKECSSDQRFVLAQLAEDGLLNPVNDRAIRQLVRRGLIVQDPQFHIVNESFRRFVRSVTTPDMERQWQQQSRRSGWGRMHAVFFTTMIALGIFLLTTQNALLQSSAAYVTTALGALGTLAKLFNMYRGSAGADKQ